MAATTTIDPSWGWLRAHDFADQPLYCESHAKEEDVIYSGSEDDHYDDPLDRQRRYEERGRQFLAGQQPLILSAALRGPFDQESGWVNPWRAKGGRVIDQATTASPLHNKCRTRMPATKKAPQRKQAISKVVEVESDREETVQQMTSDDIHQPDDDLQASVASSFNNPYMDESEIARVQDWREDVDSKALPLPRESFWVGDIPGTKKRASNPDWLRRKTAKRSRLRSANDAFDSPTHAVLQNRLTRGASPDDGVPMEEDYSLEQPTMATVRSTRASQRSPPAKTLRTSPSEEAALADSVSVDELSQDSLVSSIPSTSPKAFDATPAEVTIQKPSQIQSEDTRKNDKTTTTRTKRKHRNTRSSKGQESSNASKFTLQIKRTREADNQHAMKKPTPATQAQDTEGHVFQSQQDDSFYFRAKPRAQEIQDNAEDTTLSVVTPAVKAVLPPLLELPEFPSPMAFGASDPAAPQASDSPPIISSLRRVRQQGAVPEPDQARRRISVDESSIVELGSPAKPSITSSSVRVKQPRAVRGPNSVHQSIFIDEPTIAELGSPVPLRYADLKASSAGARVTAAQAPASSSDLSDVPSHYADLKAHVGAQIAAEAPPTSSSDLSDVPSCANTEADRNDTTIVSFSPNKIKDEGTPVPSQYAAVKAAHSGQDEPATVPGRDTAVPSHYADLKGAVSPDEEDSEMFMNDTTLFPSQHAPVVPETYAEIKDSSAVPEAYAYMKGSSVVPEAYAQIKGHQISQMQSSTPPGSESPDSKVEAGVEKHPDNSSEASSQVLLPAEDATVIDIQQHSMEHEDMDTSDAPNDSALVIPEESHAAPQGSEGPPSSFNMDDTTQSLPDAEVSIPANIVETPRIGTQDQSPWGEPRSSKANAAQLSLNEIGQTPIVVNGELQMESPEAFTEQPHRSENYSPRKCQDLSLGTEAAMACLDASFARGSQGPNLSQELPSPLLERSVLTSTSGNRILSPNPVRPSTPDTKHSSLPTPDFTLSIKSFKRLLSASPERRPSARSSIGSILANPWRRASKPVRHVRFAPLADDESDGPSSPGSIPSDEQEDVDDEDYIEAGLPKEKGRRRIRPAKAELTPRSVVRGASPPPMASLDDLPDEVDKFRKHYDVMESRRGREKAARLPKQLLPSASQQVVRSPTVEAMADRFLAADVVCEQDSPACESVNEDTEDGVEDEDVQTPAKIMLEPEAEPDVDDVSAVLDNLDDFLSAYDVDKEVDLARTANESAEKRRSMFTASQELNVNVWA